MEDMKNEDVMEIKRNLSYIKDIIDSTIICNRKKSLTQDKKNKIVEDNIKIYTNNIKKYYSAIDKIEIIRSTSCITIITFFKNGLIINNEFFR